MKKLLITSLLLGSTTAFAAPFVVKDIRIDGVQESAVNNVINSLPVRVGQRATDADLTNIVRQLFLTGQYEDVQAKADGNTLVVNIVPKAIITEVNIKGNKLIPTEALKQNLDANGFKPGDVLNRAKLEEFRRSVEEHYQSVGRYNAKVEALVETQIPGQTAVNIQITENDVAVLKALDFEGNKGFSASKLAGQMELQTDSWWRFFGNKFEQNQLNKDLETLQSFYLDRGYAKFQIADVDVQLNEDKSEARVTIKLNEGDLYKVKEAKIIGEVAGMSAELVPLLKLIHNNEPFNRSDMQDLESAIKAKLGERGYATAKVSVHPEFDETDKTVTLNFIVEAGRVYSVREIRFEGNTVSADSTLRQEMRQQEGAWLSSQLVELGKVRLDRTGFFETVESKIQPIANTDLVDVIYKVKERNTGSLNFGVGYGTESGLNYNASIRQDNFLGKGSSISLGGSKSESSTSLNFTYEEPYFTKDGVSLGGNVFFTESGGSKSRTSEAGRVAYGVESTLGFPVNENNFYSVGLSYTHSLMKNVSREYNRQLYKASMNYPDWTFKSDDFELSFSWRYNSLNRGYFPTEGMSAGFSGRVTVPGSSHNHYKLNTTIRGFYPIDRDHHWVLSGNVGLYFADGFGGKRLPPYQYYSAGGIGSLRGFSYGSVGPEAIYGQQDRNGGIARWYKSTDVMGGNAMATASLELIFPVPFVEDKNQRSVRTSVFIDAANAWSTHWKADLKRLQKEPAFATETKFPDYGAANRVRASVGVALQWQSPIGPLVFSYAKPIKKYEGDQIEQFQFNIGGTF